MTETTAIELDHVSKRYPVGRYRIADSFRLSGRRISRRQKIHRAGENRALDDVSIEVFSHENLGVIGRNGAGKSTLLQVMSAVTWPTSGSVRIEGTVAALFDLGTGLHPDFTGRENVLFYCSLLGFSRSESNELIPRITEFSELGKNFDDPIRTYSNGMRARLGFSVSVAVTPDILVIDEVLAVGDESFRRKCYTVMDEFFAAKKTVVFVSHNLEEVRRHCARVVWLDRGRVRFIGFADDAIDRYQRFAADGK